MADNLPRSTLIVGTGLAGLNAAETLRRAGYDGRLTMLGAEAELPYDRPPLSKGLLAGTMPAAKVFLRQASFFVDRGIDLRLGQRAVALEAATRTVVLADGTHLPFDAALLATGSIPLRLPLPGVDLPGVFSLRTLDDARSLAAALTAAQRIDAPITLIGAGFIGMEVAAVARQRGLAVTLVDALPAPMMRALGAEVGEQFAGLHRAHGVTMRLGVGVRELRGIDHVEEVVLVDGTRIPCGLAVIAVGVRPDIDWIRGSGIALGQGILTDAHCATSIPGIFAAGDCAEWPYAPVGGTPQMVRLEHWDNALRQGEVSARAILGDMSPFAPVPYFWSDQYDWHAQVAGVASTWDRVVLRARPAAGSFAACYLSAGRLRMALAVNRVPEFLALKKLVAAGSAVPPETLADESTDLRSLAHPRRTP